MISLRLVLELLLAAGELSGLPIVAPVPQVLAVPRAALPCACVASYDEGVVQVADDLDLDGLFGRSVLIHELTHHLQRGARGLATTPQARFEREGQATDAQNHYLAQHGSATRAAYTHRSD